MQFPKILEQLTLCCGHEPVLDENAVELLWLRRHFFSSHCSSFSFSVCLPTVLSCFYCPFSDQIIKAPRTSTGCPVLFLFFFSFITHLKIFCQNFKNVAVLREWLLLCFVPCVFTCCMDLLSLQN